jgi:hypothetical protein
VKILLACLVGAAAIGALWQLLLVTTISSWVTFGSIQTQQIVLAGVIAFLGSLWGAVAPKMFKKMAAN